MRVGALLTSATLGSAAGAAAEPQVHSSDRSLHTFDPGQTSSQTGVEAATFRFAVPAGPLDAALEAFQRITGLSVRVSADLTRGQTSDGVSGVFTADQALQQLLAGSSLSHRVTTPGVINIELRVGSDAVNVSGAAPRVESTKYAGTLVETPQTIQVIPRALIEEQGATTLSEALRNVPGITLQAGEGGGASGTSGDMFNMRGFSAANSLFVDGVRDDGLIARDVFNLEQIEVFSGPTGSDIGRSNAAGYVNLTTKSPNLAATRNLSVVYGSGENVRTSVDVNQPLSLGERGTFFGSAAARVNVLWQEGGLAGRDHVARESKSIAPAISFGLGTPTRVTVSGQVTRQDNLADYGLPAAASPVGTFVSTGVLAATPVDQSNYYGSPNFDYDRVKQNSAAVKVERDLGTGVTLRNQTRYNVTDREAVVTAIANGASYVPATNLVSLSRQGNSRKNNILSNQTSLIGRFATGTLRHEVSLGVEVSTEDYLSPGLTGLGTRAAVDLNNPDVFSPVVDMDIVPNGALNEGQTDTVAFYAFDSFDLGSRLRLTGGLRVESYTTTSHALTTAGVATDIEGRGTLYSGKAGLLYRLNSRGNVYLSWGSSLTPPGSSNFQLNANQANQNNPNVDPQESVNIEAGSKWDLAGGRLQLTGAFFRTENKNVIFVVDSTAIPPIYNQDDGQLVKGVSLAAVGRLTARWDVNVSVQYLDSESISQNAATSGRDLTLTPARAASLWTTYRFPHDIRIGGGLQYTDKTFVNTANTIVLPGFTIADVLVEAPVSPRLLFRLNVSNVTDKVYVRSVNNNGGRYNPGAPRAFLLSTVVRF